MDVKIAAWWRQIYSKIQIVVFSISYTTLIIKSLRKLKLFHFDSTFVFARAINLERIHSCAKFRTLTTDTTLECLV